MEKPEVVEDKDRPNGQPDLSLAPMSSSNGHGLVENFGVAPAGGSAGGLTDSDFQEGSYEDDADEEEEEHAAGDAVDGGGGGGEINDAGLLRSMLQDSEEYYANMAAVEAAEEKHCWVCFACEEDDPNAIWSHPCRWASFTVFNFDTLF